jgi:four helix bundle protein
MKAHPGNPNAEGPPLNPKAEGRNPKEGRRPKSELEYGESNPTVRTSFWSWGDQQDHVLKLREDAMGAKPLPRPLGERTVQFGEAVIRFAKKVPQNAVNERLISQLVGAGTSVGANYCEADDSVSGKEFKVKIGTCRKESKEAMFFLRLIASSEPTLANEARGLWREAKELNLIFGAIWRK